MAAITTAVVATGVAVKGQMDAKKAAKKAADGQEQAAIESAQFLGEAGRAASEDIRAGEDAAIGTLMDYTDQARGFLQPQVESGQEAFGQAAGLTIGGQPLTGPLADSLSAAGNQAINQRMFDTSGPVGNELARQSDINTSGLSRDHIANLLQHGQLGLAAAGDYSSIKNRAGNNIGNLFQQGGSQRASALVGSAPQLQQLSESAMDASLLSSAAGQQFKTGAAESLAGLAGNLTFNGGR